MKDEDISLENGIKMTMELHEFADCKITEEEAEIVWEGLSTGEKMRVKTEHFRIIGI